MPNQEIPSKWSKVNENCTGMVDDEIARCPLTCYNFAFRCVLSFFFFSSLLSFGRDTNESGSPKESQSRYISFVSNLTSRLSATLFFSLSFFLCALLRCLPVSFVDKVNHFAKNVQLGSMSIFGRSVVCELRDRSRIVILYTHSQYTRAQICQRFDIGQTGTTTTITMKNREKAFMQYSQHLHSHTHNVHVDVCVCVCACLSVESTNLRMISCFQIFNWTSCWIFSPFLFFNCCFTIAATRFFN